MHLLHVGLGGSGDQDVPKFEKVFDEAESWLRYTTNCWVLWTNLSARDWCNRLEAAVDKPNRRFLVCKLDAKERAGWLSDTEWKWIREKGPNARSRSRAAAG